MHIQSLKILILNGICTRLSQGYVECVYDRERERERETSTRCKTLASLSARDFTRLVGLNPSLGAEWK